MSTHQCNMSLECKSKTCFHATPHDPKKQECDRPAPCGCWPGEPDFKPTVKCIQAHLVKPREDCPDCGTKEAKGHHPGDCIVALKAKVERLESEIHEARTNKEYWGRFNTRMKPVSLNTGKYL